MKLLLDSDFLFGLYITHDPSHDRAVQLLEETWKKQPELYITNLVMQELATVVSYRVGQHESITLLDKLKEHNLIKIHINEELEDAGWSIFLSQTKKGSSFVDCANLAVIEKYKLDGILSFDRFYGDKLIR